MLKEQIQQDLRTALKNQDQVAVSTIRLVLAEVHNQEIQKKQAARDEDVMSVLRSGLKKRREAIAQFEQGGRPDLVAREQAESQIIKKYLPEALSLEELEQLIDKAIAEAGAVTRRDLGRVMKILTSLVKGRADGAEVSKLVQEKLSS